MRPFDDFVKERTYLKNVSPRTIDFYWGCNKSVLRYGDFTEEGLKRWIIGSREAGIAPTSINTRITGINAVTRSGLIPIIWAISSGVGTGLPITYALIGSLCEMQIVGHEKCTVLTIDLATVRILDLTLVTLDGKMLEYAAQGFARCIAPS
jgi:hypothetical protein